jgi:hypothetical protein
MKLGPTPGLGGMNCHAPLNPLLTLPGLLGYVNFTDASTYIFSSGASVSAVTPVKGSAGFANLETTAMEYDPTLFSGKGGIKTIDADSDITSDTDSGSPAAMTFGAVITLPVHAANKSLVSIGGTSFGNSFARLIHGGAGLITYGKTETSAFPTVVNIGAPGTVLVIVRYNSASSADTFGNSTAGFNIDPHNDYQASRIWLGDRGVGTDGVASTGFAEFFLCTQALSDAEITAVMTYWAARYDVTLS